MSTTIHYLDSEANPIDNTIDETSTLYLNGNIYGMVIKLTDLDGNEYEYEIQQNASEAPIFGERPRREER
jgi:hypothetical protein